MDALDYLVVAAYKALKLGVRNVEARMDETIHDKHGQSGREAAEMAYASVQALLDKMITDIEAGKLKV